MVVTIRDTLREIDPEHAGIYENAADYIENLGMLHVQYKEALGECDLDTIVTSHGAFDYLCRPLRF